MGNPVTYKQAMASPDAAKWQRAMEEEMQSHEENSTWRLVDLPAGRKTVKNCWIYVMKRNTLGEVEHYKARGGTPNGLWVP